MAVVGTYGGTAGQITFDSGDGAVQIMSVPDGATSVTIKNTSNAAQFLYVWIPFIQRTTDGQSPTDVTYAQWATVPAPIIGVVCCSTFTLRPNGIKEVWAKTSAPSVSPCTCTFGVTEKAITNNYSTRRDCK